MDSEIEALEASAKAIGIISIIPVILYALWADAIERSLLENPKDFTPSDLENESNKLKIAHFIIVIFQMSLYFESPIIRQAYPLASHLILITSLSLQSVLHYYTDKKLFPKKESQENLFIIFLKIIGSWMIGVLICGVFLTLFLQIGFFLIQKLHLNSHLGNLLLVISSTLAMILGLISNYALAPLHILKTLPHESLEEHSFKKTVINLFKKHSLPIPQVWQVNLEQLRIIDLSIIGLQKGKSIFKYSLFVSKVVIQQLNESEIDSLLKNELSHILLKHPTKKLLYTSLLLIGSTLLAILTGLSMIYLLHRPDLADTFGMSIGLLSFIASFNKIGRKGKYYEFEADVYTLTRLQIDFTTWAEALRKLDRLMLKNNPHFTNQSPEQTLTETEHRIQLLAAYLNRTEPKTEDQNHFSQAS